MFIGLLGILAMIGAIIALIVRLVIYFIKRKQIDRRQFNKKTLYTLGIFFIGLILMIVGVNTTSEDTPKHQVKTSETKQAAVKTNSTNKKHKKAAKQTMSATEKKKLIEEFKGDSQAVIAQFKEIINNTKKQGNNISSADASKLVDAYNFIAFMDETKDYKLNKNTEAFYEDITDAAFNRAKAAKIMQKALENGQDLSDKMQPYIDSSNDSYQRALDDAAKVK